jgi:hypothetical protein
MKKRVGKSTNMYVMFGLLAVLFISLGYLSMQSKEGLEDKKDDEEEEKKKKKTGNDSDLGKIVAALAAPKDGFRSRQGFRVREGLETSCPEGQKRKIPGGPCA